MITSDRLSRAIADSVLDGASAAAVKCRHCGTNFPSGRADLARYFREGWPICCGETAMLALRKSGKRREASAPKGEGETAEPMGFATPEWWEGSDR